MKKLLLLLLSISAYCLTAQIVPLASAQSGDYNVGSTWVGGVVPNIANYTTPVIKNGHIVTISANTPVYAGLKVESGGTLTVNSATVTSSGNTLIIEGGGTLNANTALFVAQQISLNTNAITNWSNSTATCNMSNSGTFNWLSGDINAGTPNAYLFSNAGVLNDTHEGNKTWYNVDFLNSGTYTRMGTGGGGTTTFTTDGSHTISTLSNNGTLNIAVNNTLVLTKTTSSMGGTFNIAGTLRLTGAGMIYTGNLSGGVFFTGTGTLSIESGTTFKHAGGVAPYSINVANVTVNAATISGYIADINYSVGTTLTLTNSTLARTINTNSPNHTILGTLILNGTNTIPANLPVLFKGATMTNNGTLTVDPTASFTFNGAREQTLNGNGTMSTITLNNANNLTLTGNQTTNFIHLISGKIKLTTGDLTLTWTQQGADIDGEADGDFSGRSVALSADGSIVAIGAPRIADAVNRSHVRVYKLVGSTWTKQGLVAELKYLNKHKLY